MNTNKPSGAKPSRSVSNAALLSIKTARQHRALEAGIGVPVLDVFRVESIRGLAGPAFSQTIATFTASLPATLSGLRQALAQKNQTAFYSTALELKDAANHLGAVALANLAVQLHAAGKNKKTTLARSLMTQLEGEMQRTADELNALLENALLEKD